MKKLIILLFLNTSLFITKGQIVTANLHAYYPFENNINDQTNNNYNLTVLNGSPLYTPFFENNTAIQFDGATRISSTGSFDNSNFTQTTVSLWLKVPSANSNTQTILQGAYMGIGLFVEPNTGKLACFFDGTSSNSYISSYSISDGEWHHVLIETDGNTTSMYLDGILDGSMPEILFVGNASSNNKLYLAGTNLGLNYFTGSINELRIYDRVLKPNEIDLPT